MNEMRESVSEYKIGHTTYIVKTVFNPAFQQSLSDILERLIKATPHSCQNEKKVI